MSVRSHLRAAIQVALTPSAPVETCKYEHVLATRRTQSDMSFTLLHLKATRIIFVLEQL